MNTRIALSLIAVLVFLSPALRAQGQRTAFVNSAKIFAELPETKEAERRLEAFSKPVQDTLQMMQKQLEEKFSEYQKKESMMTDQARRSAQTELQELQARAREYAAAKDQELARQREKVLTPLKEKILRAIERVAKDEKYNFVFDQTEQVQILLYGDPNHDITFKVIDRLKRGK